MQLTVNGSDVFVATGGKAFDAALPTVVFLHGAGMDHTAWALHDRWFAHHGHNVLAPDLPATAARRALLAEIGEMADWTAALLDAAGAENAKLIGHSMGSLIALETAARHPAKVRRSCWSERRRPWRSDPTCSKAAEANDHDADRHGVDLGTRPRSRARRQPCAGPVDAWRRAAYARTLRARRALQRSRRLQRLSERRRRRRDDQVPATLVLGERDMMTPAKAGRALAAATPECTHRRAAPAPVT